MQHTITFLLGSGISIPAGFPSVDKITNRVLSGDGRLGLPCRPDGSKPDETLRPVLRLLSCLRRHADARFERMGGSRRANYEDLAYLAGQLRDDLSGNRENPALVPFERQVAEELDDLLPVGTVEAFDKLGVWAGNAVDYIRVVVGAMLGGNSTDAKHLRLFHDVVRDPQVARVDLFTLNHDTLLEHFLWDECCCPVEDGFEKGPDGVFRWKPERLDREPKSAGQPQVRLFKLHGSIDWHQWEDSSKPSSATDQTGVQLCKGKGPSGHEQLCRPLFLVGTFNKNVDYTEGLYLELHYRFHRALSVERREHLVVAGYSFGDKGVNQRITEWMSASKTLRIVVIDPKPLDELHATARPAIAGKIDDWISKNRFIHWQAGIGDACWPGLAGRLFLTPPAT